MSSTQLITLAFIVLLVVAFGLVAFMLLREMGSKKNSGEVLSYEGNTKKDYKNFVRKSAAANGVDPGPNTYMGLGDGGREIYVRCLTISQLPRRVRYADTFRELFDYPRCESTVIVKPVDSEVISRKLDKQITILETEQQTAQGNPNRVRRLSTQIDKTNALAYEVEDGQKKHFNVGFLFILHADSVEDLNAITDDFRSVAMHRKIEISNCFAAQAEAFLMGAPLNTLGRRIYDKIGGDAIPFHLMDQRACNALMNYNTDYYTHKTGVPIGRNLFNQMPFIFDWYHPSHMGYTATIHGMTGSGKSALLKQYIDRAVPLGYRFVIIDSQARKGTSEGEFASVTELNGGTNYQISSKGENILNLFDVQESVEFRKISADSGYEQRTLDLNGAITDMVYNIRTMMQSASLEEDDTTSMDAVLDSDVDEIIRRAIKELFSDKGIEHGDVDTLYEEGELFVDGFVQSGLVSKKLPTLTDFFKKVLIFRRDNKEPSLVGAYRMVINGVSEYVRELYYTEKTCVFLTREEYDELPITNGYKVYVDGDIPERVIALHGIRPYYDGQSTFAISRDCPVTNIDISMLTENEKRVAREVVTRFVNEQFIKKNSEKLDSADKIIAVIDEAHESFADAYSRKTFANITRTARKRHAGIVYCTQTVVEFERYPETSDILRQAAFKIVFKQEAKDKEQLIKSLNITPSQADIICNVIGDRGREEDSDRANAHKGEMCFIDGSRVTFVKGDYLKATEALTVETDASTVIRVL